MAEGIPTSPRHTQEQRAACCVWLRAISKRTFVECSWCTDACVIGTNLGHFCGGGGPSVRLQDGLPCDGIWEPFGEPPGVKLGQRKQKRTGYDVTWFGVDLVMFDRIGIRKESLEPHQKMHQKKVVAKTATSSAPNTAPNCYLRVSKGFFCAKKKCLWKKTARWFILATPNSAPILHHEESFFWGRFVSRAPAHLVKRCSDDWRELWRGVNIEHSHCILCTAYAEDQPINCK